MSVLYVKIKDGINKTEALTAMSVLYVKIKDRIYTTEALAVMNGLYDLCITTLNKFRVDYFENITLSIC